MRYFLPAIAQYWGHTGGSTNLNEVESRRLQLLDDACQHEDSFYLCLHQMFVLHTSHPQVLHSLGGFDHQQLQGFRQMSILLMANDKLTLETVRFFAEFPVPLSILTLRAGDYPALTQLVQDFLALLGHGWEPLRTACRERGYPPFVDDMVARFGLLSPILQNILFMAVYRDMGGKDGTPATGHAIALFHANQQSYQQRLQQAKPLAPEAILAENEGLAERFRQIRRAFNDDFVCASRDQIRVPSQPVAQVELSAPVRSDSASSANYPTCSSPTSLGHLTRTQQPILSRSPSMNSGARPVMAMNSYGQVIGPLSPARQDAFTMPYSTNPQSHTFPFHAAPASVSVRRRGRPPGQSNGRRPQSRQAEGSQNNLTSHPSSNSLLPQIPNHSRPTQPGINQTTQAQTMYQQLLPPPEQQLVPIPHPQPSRVALHQAHLRSPSMRKFNAQGSEDVNLRFYQYFRRFALTPQPLHELEPTVTWQLSVPTADFRLKAADVSPSDDTPGSRCISNGSKLYRLRCVRLAPNKNSLTESEWVVAENVWPTCIYPEINRRQLEVRRRHHHNKDLPLDLTPHIQEGDNTVGVTVLRMKDEHLRTYVIAVEIIEVGELEGLLRAVQRMPASDVLSAITKSLKPIADDDDLIVVDEHTTIGITDPYTARIFDIPVRGKSCVHRECFDLMTFFETRKPAERSLDKAAPISPDDWKCPICGMDARPQTLIIDSFLQDVRKCLEKDGLLETKAILVKADGSWSAKAEKKEDPKDGREASDGGPPTNGDTKADVVTREQAVVELLGD